jgi:hypothetical protein
MFTKVIKCFEDSVFSFSNFLQARSSLGRSSVGFSGINYLPWDSTGCSGQIHLISMLNSIKKMPESSRGLASDLLCTSNSSPIK